MSLLLELYQQINEAFEQSNTGYLNRLKSLIIDFSNHVRDTENFYKEMVHKHDHKQANFMANARLIKWYNQNFLSSRETGMGLSSILRHFAQQSSGPIKKQLLDLSNLPVYSLPDKNTGSRGAGDNVKIICANLATVVESFGRLNQDQTIIDTARKFKDAWKSFQDTITHHVPNTKDKKRSEVVIDPEYKALHKEQNVGAQAVINATLERIPNERLRHVIRTEVMKSDNKLAALDKLLVQYNINLSP